MKYDTNKLARLFQEQIYEKSAKTKILSFSPISISVVIDMIGKDLELKCIGFVYHIQNLLSMNSRNRANSYELQLIDLKYNDEDLLRYISKKKNTFYSIKNHLVKHGVLYPIEKSIYFVNPYFISNIDYAKWKDIREESKQYSIGKSNSFEESSKDWCADSSNELLYENVNPSSLPPPFLES